MINFPVRQKIYLSSGLITLVFSLLIIGVIFPLISQIKIKGAELTQKKHLTEELFSSWQNLESVKKDHEQIQNDLDKQSSLLPESQVLVFIETLEEFARRTQNQQEITVLEAPLSKNRKVSSTVIDFQISLRGTFPNLLKFIIYLENSPYYNELVSLYVQRPGENFLRSSNANELTSDQISSIIKISVPLL